MARTIVGALLLGLLGYGLFPIVCTVAYHALDWAIVRLGGPSDCD